MTAATTGTALVEAAGWSTAPVSSDRIPSARGLLVVPAESHTEAVRLLPLDRARRIVAEADRALVPCGRRQAATLARLMLGAWPLREIAHDSETYTRWVVGELTVLPDDLAREAVEIATRELRWPPSRHEMCALCRRLLARRQRLRDDAASHIREHERRAAARVERERLAAAVAVALDFEEIIRANARACRTTPSEMRRAILAEIAERQAGGMEHAAAVIAVLDPIREELEELRRRPPGGGCAGGVPCSPTTPDHPASRVQPSPCRGTPTASTTR